LRFSPQSRYEALYQHLALICRDFKRCIGANGVRGMDFELNKIFGAILGVLIFVMGIGFIAGSLYNSPQPHHPGIIITVAESAAPSEGGGAAEVEPIEVRLAKANIGKGDAAHKPCLACHVFEKDGANKQGPALWGVVGNAKASHASFTAYSEAIKAKSGEKWDYANLDGFLANPKKYLEGTSMGFAGISDPQKRADLIAWLREQDDAPEPLPAQ
jgi:cytochrome c